MSMIDLEKAYSLLTKHPKIIVHSGNPVNENLISAAEEYLGIQIPLSYKNFLSKFGFLSLGGAEFYGIIDNDFAHSSTPDAIWITKNNNEEFNQPISLLTIYDIGDGSTYCLDTSQMNQDGECPVVVWPLGGYKETPVLEIVAEDFGKFFLDIVKQQIEYKKENS